MSGRQRRIGVTLIRASSVTAAAWLVTLPWEDASRTFWDVRNKATFTFMSTVCSSQDSSERLALPPGKTT